MRNLTFVCTRLNYAKVCELARTLLRDFTPRHRTGGETAATLIYVWLPMNRSLFSKAIHQRNKDLMQPNQFELTLGRLRS